MEKKRNIWLNYVCWILFIAYLVGISYFMFFSERYGRVGTSDEYRYNLVLFKEIKRFIRYRHEIGIEGFIVNLFGNILAFAPYGFCLPLLSSKDDNLLRIIFSTFFFSLLIESIQLFYKIGCFDVDDLLLNTLGGVLGFIFYRLCRTFYRYHERKKIRFMIGSRTGEK